MAEPAKNNPYSNDVLHFENHSRLTAEEIAKAVDRHKREHPDTRGKNATGKHQKTTPRR